MSEIEELEAALKPPGSGPGCQEEKRVQVVKTHADRTIIVASPSVE